MTLGAIQREGLGVLLFAGVLSPVAAATFGWALYPPSTTAMAALVGVVLGAVALRLSKRGRRQQAMSVLLALAASMPVAAILHAQANAFYTSGALLGGMIVLLGFHVAERALRHVVLRDEELVPEVASTALVPADAVVAGLEHLPPNEVRVVRAGRAAPAARASMASRGDEVPAIALAARLADAGAWLLVLFWVLVALGHRHVASGCVLLLGVLLAGRCLALLPEALATRSTSVRRVP